MRDAPQLPPSIVRQLPDVFLRHRAYFLGNAGGFSGARLWRIVGAKEGCLRRWPRGTSHARICQVHEWLNLLHHDGLEMVPAPYPWREGSTAVYTGGHWWELTRWLPGAPDSERRPNSARVAAAMRGLAQIHQAWGALIRPPSDPPIPAIERRWQLAERGTEVLDSVGTGASVLPSQVFSAAMELRERIGLRLTAVLADLASALPWTAPCQPCIRDVRPAHLLFLGDDLNGIVDFDAAGWDNVATDVARLLADWDPAVHEAALHTYHAARPLSEREQDLVQLLCRVNHVVSGLQWLHWLCLERRSFDQWDLVAQRMTDCLHGLEA